MNRIRALRDRLWANPLRANTAANVVGALVPLLVALAAIPALIHELGYQRFGVLAMAWVLLGYFSVMDLGMGQALTRSIADKLASGERATVGTTIVTGNLAILLFGVASAAILGPCAGIIASHLLTVPLELRNETAQAVELMALGLPLVCSSAGLRGVLEAYQRFDVVNLIRIPTGAFTFLAPLAVLPFSRSLPVVVAALIASRAIVWIALLAAARHVSRHERSNGRFALHELGRLARFGGWMTVTNVVGPLMVYMDRLLIGATVSIAAVAYYVTPFEVVTKVLVVPAAVAPVLFSAIVHRLRGPASSSVADILMKGQASILLIVLPPLFVAATFAHELLAWWIGPGLARESARVLQILAIGVLFNALAILKSGLIQAAGRPDLTARTHLCEFPLYAWVLWTLTTRFGVEGAALAWTARMIVDHLVLTAIAARISPGSKPALVGSLAWTVAASCCLLPAVAIHDDPAKAFLALPAAALMYFVATRSRLVPRRAALGNALE